MIKIKHIVMFSGGVASSYVAWLLSQEQKKEDIILLYTPVGAEHPDADRFRKEFSEYLGIPITEVSCGMDLWELIEKQNCLPSVFIPFCSRILKQEPANKFIKELQKYIDVTVYLGYGKNEHNRVQKYRTRNDDKWKSSFLIYERQIEELEMRKKIQNCFGIKLPEPYYYLKHNNCIPCFKASKNEWIKYARYYPEMFEKAVEMEEYTGHTVFQDITLQDIKQMAKNGMLFESKNEIDRTPCECVY